MKMDPPMSATMAAGGVLLALMYHCQVGASSYSHKVSSITLNESGSPQGVFTLHGLAA